MLIEFRDSITLSLKYHHLSEVSVGLWGLVVFPCTYLCHRSLQYVDMRVEKQKNMVTNVLIIN